MWQLCADHEQKQELGDETITRGLDTTRPITEVLQLRFGLTAVVSGCRLGLVFSSPEGPSHDEAGPAWRPEPETGQKIADLGHRRQERCQAHQAAAGVAGLLSFALAQVARRRSAAKPGLV